MNHLTFRSGLRPIKTLCLLAFAGALGACGFQPIKSTSTGTGAGNGTGGEGGSGSTQAGGDECSDDYACSYLAQSSCDVASCVAGACEVHHSTEPQCALCDTDADCAGLAKPNDPCSVPKCYQGEHTCELIPNPDTTVCQCHDVFDCDWSHDTACKTTTCEVNKCIVTFAPAGPTPDQTPGDCAQVVCDGTTEDPIKVPLASDLPGDVAGDCAKPACDGVNPYPVSTPDPSDLPTQVQGNCSTQSCGANGIVSTQDLSDIPDDNNECTADSCDPTFGDGVHTPTNTGKACLAGAGFCFQGECMTTCQPQNPASCGGEGLGEPANNSGSTPLSYVGPAMCGLLNSSDQDWYTFHAHDADFVYNILEFDAWSTASTIQMCAYVKCDDNSTPGGGPCPLLVPGPNGSQGCCWTGASAGFHKSWDLDCAGGDDSGDVYVRVGTPGGDACEQYGVSMSY